MSGHMFFSDEYYGFDDALYAGARLLRILAGTEKSFLIFFLMFQSITQHRKYACRAGQEKSTGWIQSNTLERYPMIELMGQG